MQFIHIIYRGKKELAPNRSIQQSLGNFKIKNKEVASFKRDTNSQELFWPIMNSLMQQVFEVVGKTSRRNEKSTGATSPLFDRRSPTFLTGHALTDWARGHLSWTGVASFALLAIKICCLVVEQRQQQTILETKWVFALAIANSSFQFRDQKNPPKNAKTSQTIFALAL